MPAICSPLNMLTKVDFSKIKILFNENFLQKKIKALVIVKPHMSITAISISQSLWNFVKNTAVILPCSVQHFKVTGQLSNEISWELCSWDNIIMFQYKTDWAPCICIWACMQISQTIWNFVQSTAVILPCSVQNFKMIGQLSNEILWEFCSWDNIVFQYNTDRAPCICIYACMQISQSIWNFVQSTAVILPCSVQNFKLIGQISNEISWEFYSWENIIMFQYNTGRVPCICICACMHNICWLIASCRRQHASGRHQKWL